MAVSFASYEIPRSGLFVNERGLYVTGHNIANVNTAGYVRQQAMIKNAPCQNEFTRGGSFQLGLGADIQEIRQIRHTFLDNIYRQENTTLGYWESRDKTFQDVQSILAEPLESGFQNVVNQFWDSWQELSKDPASLTVRALVRQRGEALAQQINHMGTQLDKLQDDLDSEIQVRIDEVNETTSQIAKLNLAILKTEVTGDTANDYRDQRNNLVDRLSKLVNAEVTEMQDGQIDITVGGYYLVSKATSKNLYGAERNQGDMFVVPKLEGTNIEVPMKNGIIKGLMESRGEVSAEKTSVLNGNPPSGADIVFAVDTSLGGTYLTNIKSNITKITNELKRSGADYNLRLTLFSDTASATADYGTDSSSLINAIPDTSDGLAGNNFGDTNGVIERLENTSFRENSNKFAIVFTGESINGNTTIPVTSAVSCINRLNAIGVKTSIVTSSSLQTTSPDMGEIAWNAIASGTGGGLYDIGTMPADYGNMMSEVGKDINDKINESISLVSDSDNIVSDIKRRLNALVNILARKVNYIHNGGVTLDGKAGGDFFTVLDNRYPVQMGNIRLNSSFSGQNGLNNIVAAGTNASGDNTIALEIAGLRNVPMIKDTSGTLSMDDYYQSIILHVGNYGSDADRITENQSKLVSSADSYRQAVTGVSMDEEMTSMMKYKFAYDAASKALNVVDQMMQTVIERLGIVGR